MKLIVFGNPIAHSLSPQLHAQFAAQFGLVIDYQRCLVLSDQFTQTVDAFRKANGDGANITTPFKVAAFDYADQLTSRARLAGAVNTFIFREGICMGDNTDGVGFVRDCYHHDIALCNKNILIIGAGGAARGILGEIIREKPHKIMIHNRTIENTQKIITDFSPYFPIDIFDMRENADVMINATRQDFSAFELPISVSKTVCYDLNYIEAHCTFLEWAEKHHAARAIDGLGMLIEQGAESFFQWAGKMPQTDQVMLRLAHR